MIFDIDHWKPSPIYPDKYFVSDKGEVYSVKAGRILKPRITKYGYYQYSLSKQGKIVDAKAHRLVALAFIPNPENKPHIDHINTIKTDNRVENLRWVTPYENAHNPITLRATRIDAKSKLPLLTEANIKRRYGGSLTEVYKDGVFMGVFDSQNKAAEYAGVCCRTVSKCVKGIKTSEKGYTFKSVEAEVV